MNEHLNNDLERLTGEILASYDVDGRTHRIGQLFLPSRERIVQIVDEIRQLLFPGYFGSKHLTPESVKFHVGHLLSRLGEGLTDEINHCLCAGRRCEDCPTPEPCRKDAEKIAHRFLARVPAIRHFP